MAGKLPSRKIQLKPIPFGKIFKREKKSRRRSTRGGSGRLLFSDRGGSVSYGPVLLFVAVLAAAAALFALQRQRGLPVIPADVNETEGFRSMQLSEKVIESMERISAQTDESRYKILAVLMAASGFRTDSHMPDGRTDGRLPVSLEEYDAWREYYERIQEGRLSLLEQSYSTLLSDLVYFPVMKSSRREENGVSYADSWFAERAYQDKKHAHEGTDIMALNNERGYYPIVSMTDGVVENLGWLEKGGYRVGIRSPHGAYFYYAHLYRYAEGLEKGDSVKAGQLLGFMGDSGYSKVEGTVGNFDVHLHLGIYMKTEHYEEISVNPYWILRWVEEEKVVGDY